VATPTTSSTLRQKRQEYVRPAILGLMDGSVSTLAPIFAAAQMTQSFHVFIVGLAAATGAGLSMGLAEALSHGSDETMEVAPWAKGLTTGIGTTLGGLFHTLPFLIADLGAALVLAYIVVAVELLAIAYIRYRYLQFPLWRTVALVIGGGGLVFALGIALGRIGALL
jgi:VIT1/CCC1 family predicted Fe2+/Mn2+ transporter